jgi:hypothetical protein
LDGEVRPDLDTVLALRRGRMSTVREVIDLLTGVGAPPVLHP